MNHNLLGDQGRRKSNYDPDLARRINEEVEREGRRKPKKGETPQQEFQTDILNPQNYILLEGRQHGVYQYDDMFVSMHRLGMNPQIEAIKDLGFAVADTAQEQDGTPYIGNINWQEALKLNLMLGGRTLAPRQGIDFLWDLRKGIESRKKLYDGNGMQISSQVLQRVYSEIAEVREPWRAEWLDADFRVVDNVLHINYDHELKNGILVPRISEPLEDYLDAQGVKVRFANFNRHGLPTRENKKGEISYWKPFEDNNSVARFSADLGGAGLHCSWSPGVRYVWLGVRFVHTN